MRWSTLALYPIALIYGTGLLSALSSGCVSRRLSPQDERSISRSFELDARALESRLVLLGYDSERAAQYAPCLIPLIDRLRIAEGGVSSKPLEPKDDLSECAQRLKHTTKDVSWLVLRSIESLIIRPGRRSSPPHQERTIGSVESGYPRDVQLILWRREGPRTSLPVSWRTAEVISARQVLWGEVSSESSKTPLHRAAYPTLTELRDVAHLSLDQALASAPAGALLSISLRRPDVPISRDGSWAFHLSLGLPVASLDHRFTLTHPVGAPLTSFGPQPTKDIRYLTERRLTWRVGLTRPPQLERLYISRFPSWTALTQWAWAQLTLSSPRSIGAHEDQFSLGVIQWRQRVARVNTISKKIRDRVSYRRAQRRGYRPTSKRATLRRGYGDCKDLSALARQELTDQGVPSYFALTSTRPQSTAMRQVPSMGWFNHVLLWVPSGGVNPIKDSSFSLREGLWVDLTTRHPSPQGLEGRWAWILKGPKHGEWRMIKGTRSTATP